MEVRFGFKIGEEKWETRGTSIDEWVAGNPLQNMALGDHLECRGEC